MKILIFVDIIELMNEEINERNVKFNYLKDYSRKLLFVKIAYVLIMAILLILFMFLVKISGNYEIAPWYLVVIVIAYVCYLKSTRDAKNGRYDVYKTILIVFGISTILFLFISSILSNYDLGFFSSGPKPPLSLIVLGILLMFLAPFYAFLAIFYTIGMSLARKPAVIISIVVLESALVLASPCLIWLLLN